MVKTLINKGIDKGKTLLQGRQESIASAAFIMMVLIAVTKVVGLAKIHIFARIFGASTELDIFWAAFTIPDIIFNVIVLGSVNAALIPLFAEALRSGTSPLSKIFSDVTRVVAVLSVLLGVIVFVFARPFAEMITMGGFAGFDSADFGPAETAQMAVLMRIMVISPIVLGVSSVVTAALQVHKRFLVPALAPLFYNVGIIIGAVVFASWMGRGVVGLAWGVVFGTFLHLLVQLPLMSSSDLNISIFDRINVRSIFKVGRLALPRVFSLVGEQISILVNTFIAIGLGSGALSAFRFASSIYLLPVQLLGSTIAQAALPTLSIEYQESEQLTLLDKGKTKRDLRPFTAVFSKTLQQLLFLMLPAFVFFVVLRLPIVRLVLGAGAFDWTDTVMTAWALALFGLAMVMHGVVALVVRAFFAMQDTVVPVIVSLVSLIVNILGSIFLTNFFSHYYDWRPLVESIIARTAPVPAEFLATLATWITTRNSSPAAVGGLALSAGLALMVEAVLLLFVLNKRIRVISWKLFWQPVLKKLFVSWVMFMVMYSMYKFWNFKLDTSTVVSIISLFTVVGGVGLATYIAGSLIVDVSEVTFFVQVVQKGLRRIRSVLGGGGRFEIHALPSEAPEE